MSNIEILKKLNKDRIFTPEEIETIKEYTGSSYELFSLAEILEQEKNNPFLSEKRKELERITRLPASESRIIPKNILTIFRKLIDNSKCFSNVVLYRGTSFNHFYATNIIDNNPNCKELHIEQTFTSLVYQSSSLSLNTAFEFMTKHNGLIIEYHIPRGFNALWVDQISKQNELEFILKKDSQYIISDIGRIDRKGNITHNEKPNYISVKTIKKV